MEKLRDIKNILDYSKVVDSYINTEDWRVKENSTVTYSIGGLILHNSGAISANYWLSEIYDEEIANSHRNGDFHLHDLSMLTGYCAGWSLRELLVEGLGGVKKGSYNRPIFSFDIPSPVSEMITFIFLFFTKVEMETVPSPLIDCTELVRIFKKA